MMSMKKKNICFLAFSILLCVPWIAAEDGLELDGIIKCSNQVLREREIRRESNITITRSEKISVGSTLLMVVVMAVAACFVSLGFGKFQDLIYKRPVTLDSTFDAGGETSSGLITVSTMCDRTTMATLLGSSSMVLQYGVSGSYWYAIGGGIHLIVFAYLSLTFKTRAPGAKTILQFIRARFGNEAHLMYMVYCLFCNFVVFGGLLVDATQAIDLIVQDLMPEFSSMLLALLIGGYTIVGGLGGTFYVSYLNAMFLFILIIILQIVVYLNPSNDDMNPLGNTTKMYELVDCWDQRSVFTNSSFMSFGAPNEWKFGFNNFFYFFGFIIIDQSNWQGSVASKPASGAVGFIAGGLCWMAISIGLATTSGMAFVALSSAQGYPILSDEEINAGLVFPTVAQTLLGTSGTYLMLALILLAVMSTGSGQVIAIASIIIYDIYQPYIQPFKKDPKQNHCLLCNQAFDTKKNDAFTEDICDCGSMRRCLDCRSDDKDRASAKKDGQLNLPHYSCITHKDFRVYQDKLLKFANWCVVVTTIVTVPVIWPLTSIANNLDLDLITIFKLFVVPLNSGWVPLSLAIIWTGASSLGIIAGCLSGLVFGILVWLVAVSSDADGLTLASATGSDTLLAGNITAMLVSGVVTVIISKVSKEGNNFGWTKTLAINNPLTPWIANYEKELEVDEGDRYCDLPDPDHVVATYKKWSYFSIGLPLSLVAIFMLILPLSITSQHFTLSNFSGWMSFCNTWTILAALWVVLIPALQQAYEVYIQMNREAKVASMSSSPMDSISSLSNKLDSLDGSKY